MFLLSCSGVDNIDILIDQDGTGHFYNKIGLFNKDSTKLRIKIGKSLQVVIVCSNG